MTKQKDSRFKNTKIAIVFFALLAFFVGLSLIFKIVLVVRAGQFDDSRRFNLTVLDNKTLKALSLSGASNSIAVFNLDRSIGADFAGKFLKIPIDGFIYSPFLLPEKIDSLFFKALFNYREFKTNLTIIDLIKLLVFSKTISSNAVVVQDIQKDINSLELDRIVGRQAADELIEKDNQTIQIINGTDIAGLGNRLARLVTNMGGDVIIVATEDRPRKLSIITYNDQKTYTVTRLGKVLGYPAVRKENSSISDITIIIGEDKVSSAPF